MAAKAFFAGTLAQWHAAGMINRPALAAEMLTQRPSRRRTPTPDSLQSQDWTKATVAHAMNNRLKLANRAAKAAAAPAAA